MKRWRRAVRLREALPPVLTAGILAGLLFAGGAQAERIEAAEDAGDSLCEAEYETTTWDAALGAGLAGIRAERLPARWYAGDYGKKPTVRRQGSDETCWAFAAVSALEAALLPEQKLVFSADHMTRKNAFTIDIDEGGDYLMTMAYLSGWQGPVTEEEDPYGDGASPDGLTSAVHVQEIQLLEDAKPGIIKTAIREYGAVQTSLYMKRSVRQDNTSIPSETEAQTDCAADGARDSAGQETAFYYNDRTRAYFCPDEQAPNHDVVILGWDDDYSRFLFSETPDQDGAYICQNTWEDGFGEDGIFYVSYADPNIAKTCVCYTRIEPADNYAKIYQYDDCGWQGRQGYADESCWCANIYTAAGDGTADLRDAKMNEASDMEGAQANEAPNETAGELSVPSGELLADSGSLSGTEAGEQLAAVGFYAVGPDTSYEISLVHDFQDETDFSEREYLQKGELKNAGYYTIDLNEPQPLANGERFAVIVKLTTPGADEPVAVEYRADKYTQNVTTEGKESYLSQYGELWENTQERFGTNVCLKAYTK